jgi:protein-disulfide isomerase
MEPNNIATVNVQGSTPKNNNFLAISILVGAILVSGSIVYAFGIKGSGSGTSTKVPKTQFAQCVNSREYQAQVQQDKQAAEASGIQGTPATFVNNLFINGAEPWSVFKEAIDNALAGKKVVAAAGDPKPTPVGARDVILGDTKAPVTVIEYGDYQCPFCARFFTDVEPLLREQYIKTGKVRMIFRNYPFLGNESIAAAEAAECAKDQGKFWDFHDALYTAEHQDGRENNGNLTNQAFYQLADSIKLK